MEAPDEAKMPGCVAGSTVLLHLAEDEASPVTPLEAARMGLPLVASALPAFREVFGEKGLWVEARDPATVADALEVALIAGSDKQERQARTALAAPFTWEAAARAHGDAWKRMLSGP